MPSFDVEGRGIDIPYIDKIVHIFLFAACSYSVSFDIRLAERKPIIQLVGLFLIAAIGLGLGFWIEELQGKYLGRTNSIEDLVADGVGLFIGVFVAYLFHNWLILGKEEKN